jgi:hypothetical protein
MRCIRRASFLKPLALLELQSGEKCVLRALRKNRAIDTDPMRKSYAILAVDRRHPFWQSPFVWSNGD